MKVEASQQGISASVMEVKAKVTQVIQFTHDQQNQIRIRSMMKYSNRFVMLVFKLNRWTASNLNQSSIPTYPVISGPSFPEPQTSPSYGRPSPLHPMLVEHHLHGL
jgi:hypothetical protein